MEFDTETRAGRDQTPPRQASPLPKFPSPSPLISDEKLDPLESDPHSDVYFEGKLEEQEATQKRHSNPDIQHLARDFKTKDLAESSPVEHFETSLFGLCNEPNPQSPPLISPFLPFEHCSSTDLGHCSEPIYFGGHPSETPPPPRDSFASTPQPPVVEEVARRDSPKTAEDLISEQKGPGHQQFLGQEIAEKSILELEDHSAREKSSERDSLGIQDKFIEPDHSLDREIELSHNFGLAETSAEIELKDHFSAEKEERSSSKVAANYIDREREISESPLAPEDYNTMFSSKQHHTSFEDHEQPGLSTLSNINNLDHTKAVELGGELLNFGEEPKAVPRGSLVDEGFCPSPLIPDTMGERRTVDGCGSSGPTSPDSTSALHDVFTSPLMKDPPTHDAVSPLRTERQEANNQAIEDLTNMIEKVNLRANQDPTPGPPFSREQAGHLEAMGVKANGADDFIYYCGGDEDVQMPTQNLPESFIAGGGLENGHETPLCQPAQDFPVKDGASAITPVATVKSPTTGSTKKISQTAPAKSGKMGNGSTATTTPTKTIGHSRVSNGLADHHNQAQDQVKPKAAKSNGVGLKATPATAKLKGITRKTDYSHVQSKCGSLAFMKGAQLPPPVKGKEANKVDGHHTLTTTTTTSNGTHHSPHTPNGVHLANGSVATKRTTAVATSNQAKGGGLLVGNGNATGHSPSHQVYKKPANLKSVHSKIGSLENASYKPTRIEKKIETVKLDFKCKAKSKIGSLDNAAYVPSGGNVKVQTHKLNFKETAAPKVQTKFIKSPQTATSPLVETGDA